MSKLLLGLLIGSCFISGCASTILSDDRLISNTAGVLGVPQNELTITNRREETPNTYYIATTKSGKKYACVINGGNMLTFGMTNPPSCVKK